MWNLRPLLLWGESLEEEEEVNCWIEWPAGPIAPPPRKVNLSPKWTLSTLDGGLVPLTDLVSSPLSVSKGSREPGKEVQQ